MKCQPAAVSFCVHDVVRFGWLQAMFVPPRYTPTVRYGEAFQADMADMLGVAHGSNPRPVTTAAACADGAARGERDDDVALAAAALARVAEANRRFPSTPRKAEAERPHVTV